MKNPRPVERLEPRVVNIAQGPVEYAEFGQGPPVVALHGAMGGFDQSAILAQTIGQPGYRYIALSRPGYLGTPLSSGGSPEEQGELVAALLERLGVARAGVMAVSGGGPAALNFALAHPGACAGLVLAATCAGPNHPKIPLSFKLTSPLMRSAWLAGLLGKKAAQDPAAAAARSVRDPEVLQRTINDPEAWPLFAALLCSTADQMHRRIQGTENDFAITRTATFALEKLAVPLLTVHGTADPHVPFEQHARRFSDRVPGAEVLAVEGGEHVTIFTHRDQVRPKVAEFMGRYFSG